ncbi:MAG: rod shape-determining protein MreC [Schleiferiaceae bacterium]|nr:rod shape-determining protein MreC [Schleiferiaceae bacterium]
MRNLFALLAKYKTFFLFLVLQIVALVLMFNSLTYQRTTLLNASNHFSGSALSSYHQFQEYLNLSKTNASLARENARLRATSKKSYFEVFKTDGVTIDTLYQQQYTFTEAQVINSSFSRRNNYLTLNKGSRHGIEKGMAVIAPEGVIGVVKDVSTHFSTVLPILHSNAMVGGAFANNGFFGSVTWPGKHYREAKLNDVPKHAKLTKGDTVITDGRSTIFPKGEVIGFVKQANINPAAEFLDVTIELAVDFTNLEYVYVIDNLMQAEQLELEKRSRNE